MRQRLSPEERQARLLEVGLELFARRPYEEVSTQEIAQAAGISKALLFHYFPRKLDFYLASLSVAAERLLEATEPDPRLPQLERLWGAMERYLEFVDRFQGSFTLLMQSGMGGSSEAVEIVERCRTTLADRVLTAIGVSEARPALRLAVKGWISFVEASSIDWLKRRDLPRASLLSLWTETLRAALLHAQCLDPQIELALEG